MKLVASQIQSAFAGKTAISREDLKRFCHSLNPDMKDQSFNWLTYHLCHGKIIRRIAHNTYTLYKDEDALADYWASLTDETKQVLDYLIDRFPLLSFSVWETNHLNEFANHQLERNCIFVEVEKPLEQSVFESLREIFVHPVLYKPSKDNLYLYSERITIVILPLTSEAPVCEHRATIEKILVDLFANTLVGGIINPSEYQDIFEDAFSKYAINKNVILRYARRRGKADKIKEVLETIASREGEGCP